MNARKLTTKEAEDKAIAYFRGHLHSCFNVSTAVLDTPDRNGVQGGCDFILARNNEHWAVDVTEIDSYTVQRDDAARVLKYKECIEHAAKESQPHIFVHVGLEPDSIPKSLAAESLGPYVRILLSKLGPDNYDKVQKDTSKGFPIYYWIDDPQGIEPDCFVHVVGKSRKSEDQSWVLLKRLHAKDNQLEKYKNNGYKTAVLLDVWDIQLSSPRSLAVRFADLLPKLHHSNICEIWLLYSATEPYRIFPLKYKAWVFENTDKDIELIKQHMSRRANMLLKETPLSHRP